MVKGRSCESEQHVTFNYRHAAYMSFKKLHEQGYNFSNEHGDNLISAILLEKGD